MKQNPKSPQEDGVESFFEPNPCTIPRRASIFFNFNQFRETLQSLAMLVAKTISLDTSRPTDKTYEQEDVCLGES